MLGWSITATAKMPANYITQISEAKNKAIKAKVRVVLHDMNNDGLRTDRNHRLWNGVIDASNSRSFSATQNDSLHMLASV
jgi:sugar lactone lactonase YvrE